MKKLNVALLAFFDEEGRILLNRRNDSAEELWEIIGGGIEENEEPFDAIRREILEELNYSIDNKNDDLVFVDSFNIENDMFSADVHFFKARFPGLHKFSSSDETFISDLKLYTIEEALTLPLLPMTRRILQS